jgi:hypothetical protein
MRHPNETTPGELRSTFRPGESLDRFDREP